jgi:hypothetical protein
MTTTSAGPVGRLRNLLADGVGALKELELELLRLREQAGTTPRPGVELEEAEEGQAPAIQTDETSDLGAQALYRRIRKRLPKGYVFFDGPWKGWSQMTDAERAWFRGASQECQRLRADPPYLAVIRAAHNQLVQHYSGQDPLPVEAAHTYVYQAWMRLDTIIHPERYESR